MKTIRRTPMVLSCAVAVALCVPAGASADSVVSNLRVEGPDDTALDPGTSYSNDTARLRANNGAGKCNDDGDKVKLLGPNAMGIVDYAGEVNGKVDPLYIQEFDLGRFVCGINKVVGSDEPPFSGWTYNLNHEQGFDAADDVELERGDEVLWYFSEFGEEIPTELDLRAPDRTQPGQVFDVKAFEYDAGGDREPAEGVTISGGAAPVVTDGDGEALVVAAADDTTVRGERGGDIPTPPIEVCVDSDIEDCPERRGERIYGSDDDDQIKGTRGADRIAARRGDDKIDVQGNEVDKVDCGPGRDEVDADGKDKVDDDCERVD